MFHWICPECGREIPPAVKECQACDPSASIKVAAVEPAVELVAAPIATPPFIAPTPNPDREGGDAAAIEPIALLPAIETFVPPASEGADNQHTQAAIAVETPVALLPVTEASGPSPANEEADKQHTEAASVIEEPVALLPATVTSVPTPASEGGDPQLATALVEHHSVPAPQEIVETEPRPSETVSMTSAPSPAYEEESKHPAEPIEPPAVVATSAPDLPETIDTGALITEPPIATALEASPALETAELPIEASPTVEPPAITAEASPTPNPDREEGDMFATESAVEPAKLAGAPAIVADATPAPQIVEPTIEPTASVEPVAPPLPTHHLTADQLAETLELPIPKVFAPHLILGPHPRPAESLIEAVSPEAAPLHYLEEDNRPAEPSVTAPRETIDPEPRQEVAVSAPHPEPAAEPGPTPEPIQAEANAPEPPSIAQPPAPETLIPVHELPDPLLALAEEIRAAQAARAATGLFKLAGAVGVREQAPEPTPAPTEASTTSHQAPQQPEPIETTASAASEATAHAAAPVALLAPPEPAPTHLNVPEPAGIQEVRPVALAPVPQPAAEPEPTALAEPQAQPAALATEPSREGPTLPLAPFQQYTPATSTSIQPARPPVQILATETGPRITLPGPTLPPQLARLQEANVVTIIGEDTAIRKKEAIEATKPGGTSNWLVSGLVMLLLLAVGLAAVFYLFPHSVADAKPTPTPAIAATSPAPTTGTSPLAKFIEVTGFRIVTSPADANKKSEVQYLVVNHSDADISDANVFITLRGNKPGQPPLVRFSFKIPSLGPYESKEMSSPIEKSPRALTLPDWQDLRAEVQISQ